MEIAGKIIARKEGNLYIKVPFSGEIYGTDVTVRLEDELSITPSQRGRAYALLGEIADWSGESVQATKERLKEVFMKLTGEPHFSLSNCSKRIAKDYTSFLIEFMLYNDIPSNRPLYKEAEDIGRYVYACLFGKVCCICGRKAQLHHVDTVGMGRDRKAISHLGLRALPLCDIHHREIHQIGTDEFLDRYAIQPVKIDEKIAKKYNLGG